MATTIAPTTTPATKPATTPAPAGKAGALASLTGNVSDFLGLLMTQLKNQDPTSPLDTNQFTSQLVQFASVEQQINQNSSLTKLIELTQGNAVLQSSAMVGKQVEIDSDRLVLQAGQAALSFSTAATLPVRVSVLNEAGIAVREADVASKAGANTWKWDGRDSAGRQLPDGAYRVAVTTAAPGTPAQALPFSVLATATGVQRADSGMQLQLGALSVNMSAVKSVTR